MYVVDPGVVKQKSYDPATGMDSLGVCPSPGGAAVCTLGTSGRGGIRPTCMLECTA